MAGHRYWRVYVDANNNGSVGFILIADIQFRIARHSHIRPTGTVISGGAGSNDTSPTFAFDGNSGTYWERNVGAGAYIGLDFGGNQDIIEVTLQAPPGSTQYMAKDFKVEYSDDNSSWTTALTKTGETSWSNSETRAYIFGSPSGISDPQAQQLGVYALANQPAESANASQIATPAVVASEGSSLLYKVFSHQLGIYALCRTPSTRRHLRAWRFKQDEHEFYVLNLGETMTLVYDKLTGQWAQWKSPGYNYWRGADGCAWEGYNLCCDPITNVIWKIDADGRLDDETTAITSQVIGMLTERFRKNTPCFMAELAVSEAQPPAGIEAGDAYFQLRTSKDGTDWYDHGQVLSEDAGDDITVRWYGLGLMNAPGHVFEITDTGYARRIDGFNIEVGGNASQ
jgi:hypothetical protein